MARTYRKISIDREIMQKALERAESLPVFERSHRKREANLVGCLGEIVFEKFMQSNRIRFCDNRSDTQHDYVIRDHITVDVKTKDRTVVPRIHFDNSVPLYNHDHQRPDYYYFVSLLRSPKYNECDSRRFTTAFLLGGIDLPTLEEKGKIWRQGETDPANGTTFWTACINISMAALLSNRTMLAIFRGDDS